MDVVSNSTVEMRLVNTTGDGSRDIHRYNSFRKADVCIGKSQCIQSVNAHGQPTQTFKGGLSVPLKTCQEMLVVK